MFRTISKEKALFVVFVFILILGAVYILPLVHLPNSKCKSVTYYEPFTVEARVPMSPYYAALGVSKNVSHGKVVTLCLNVGAREEGYYPVDIEFTLPDGITLKRGNLKQKAILRKEMVFDIDVEIKEPGRYTLSGGMRGKDVSAFDESVLDALDEKVKFYEAWGNGWPGSWHQASPVEKHLPSEWIPNLYTSIRWMEVDKPDKISYFTNKRDLLNSVGYSTYSTPTKVIASASEIKNFMNYYQNELKAKGWVKVSGSKSLYQANYPSEEYIYQKGDYIYIFGIDFNSYSNPNQFYIKHN